MSHHLPLAPRQLAPGHLARGLVGGALAMLAALGIAGGYGVWQWGAAQDIVHDSALWRDGDVTTPADVEGRQTSHSFLFNDYDLQVRFRDETGEPHEGKVEFSRLFTSVDADAPTEVRFRKGHPEDFVLSWAAASTTSRWMAFLFMALAGVGLIGGSVFFLGFSAVKNARVAKDVAERGVEVECELTQVEEQVVQGRATGYLVLRFKLPEQLAPGAEPLEAIVKQNPGPFLVDNGMKIVVLVDPHAPKRFLAPRADLFPLVADAPR